MQGLLLLLAALAPPPFEPVPGVATCLRATGEPGTLALLGPLGRRASATDLLTASGDLRERVTLGNLVDCAAVATDASGAAVVAGPARHRRRIEVRAAVRDPGGALGPPARLGGASERAREVVAAVSPRGDAVVAWAQVRGSEETERVRIVAARRAPGAPFGALERLTPWRRADTGALDGNRPRLAAGADDAGALTVVWVREPRRRSLEPFAAPVETATTGPGGGFGTPQRVGDAQWSDPVPPALAVAPGGRALLGWTFARMEARASYAAPMAASGTLTTGFGPPVALGSPARSVNGLAPLVLPGGTPVLAFTDNVPTADFLGAVPEFAAGGGRLHVFRPGEAPADPPAPRLRVRALPSTGGRVRIDVRCSAACDVRATVPTGAGVVGGGAAASLPRAGRRVLRLRGDPAEPIAWRRRSVPVHVLATVPGGARKQMVIRRVRLG